VSDPAPNLGLDSSLIDRGGWTRIVLNIRRHEFPQQPEFESLPLPVLVATDDNPWAFTRSGHAPLWSKATGEQPFPCIYGYSDRFGLVVNATPLAGVARAYQLAAYQSARFVGEEPGRPLWSSARPADTEPLRAAVQEGCGMRVAVTDADGARFALNVHLAEVYSPSDIALYTEFDAIPAFALHKPFLQNLAATLARTAAPRGGRGQSFGALGQPQRVEFTSVYFRLRLNGQAEQWDIAARNFGQPRPYRYLAVVAAN